MFVPLKDNTPLQVIRFQYVTGALIILNVLVFLLTGAFRGSEALMISETGFGVVPSELLDVTRSGVPGLNPVSEPFTLVTYMFLHGSWLHLLGNMAFLWVFADNVEDAFGHAGFTFYYLLCGIAAAGLHVLMSPDSHDPLVGASGAVSGVMAAYLILYPKARVWVLLFMQLPLPIPAYIVLGAWIILQIASLFLSTPDGEMVAWWAHIGGFATGLVLTLAMRSRLLVKA